MSVSPIISTNLHHYVMNRRQQVLLMLKPKVKAFGFNRKELQGIAAHIADNLEAKDDASLDSVGHTLIA